MLEPFVFFPTISMCDQTQELEEQRKATQFKASAARSLIIPPFVPKPSDKALSEISNFTLHRFETFTILSPS